MKTEEKFEIITVSELVKKLSKLKNINDLENTYHIEKKDGRKYEVYTQREWDDVDEEYLSEIVVNRIDEKTATEVFYFETIGEFEHIFS